MIADLAVALQNLLARSDCNRRIHRRPVDDIDRIRPGQLKCRMMGLRRQRDDQIEVIILELFQRLRLAAPEGKTDLVEHDIHEGIALVSANAKRDLI